MKKLLALILALALCLGLCACGVNVPAERDDPEVPETSENGEDTPTQEDENYEDAVKLVLTGSGATVDGAPAEESGCVAVGGEIVYYHDMDSYESGNTYGEGTESDKHTEAEAAEHTLITITKAGRYYVTGSLKGQLAVDLGEGAEGDPDAKVTLIFGGADITCEIAPAVIFYNVYECADGANTDGNVDTSAAGANVIIADGSENNIHGANVAKIYKDNGEAKKLHKYDAAFYSKMSMNINGGAKGTGVLNIEAENEGLDSEMHLTVNGGNINIESQDDGINTNEDGISVTTINGGTLNVKGGLGAEGDGIDSNGWLTINGGVLYASGSGRTGDGGIDADMGITINGGTVVAFGSRNDAVQSGPEQVCVQFTFASIRSAGSTVKFVDAEGYGMMAQSDRDFQSLVFAGPNLEKNKEYYLYVNDIAQEYSGNLDSWGAGTGAFGGEITGEVPQGAGSVFEVPEGFSEWLDSAKDIPEDIKEWLESLEDAMEQFGGQMGEIPQTGNQQGGMMPGGQQGGSVPEMPQGGMGGTGTQTPEMPTGGQQDGMGGFVKLQPETESESVFVITDAVWNFSGIYDSPKATGKETVSFMINKASSMEDIFVGDLPEITSVECSKEVPEEDIQFTLEYIGSSEEITVSRICLLSEGYGAVNGLFEGLEAGSYRLTVGVAAENTEYTGSSIFYFDVVE